MPHLKCARGVLGCFTATRGLFGGSKERPRVSQSKVLSGDDGPLFYMEGERVQLSLLGQPHDKRCPPQ